MTHIPEKRPQFNLVIVSNASKMKPLRNWDTVFTHQIERGTHFSFHIYQANFSMKTGRRVWSTLDAWIEQGMSANEVQNPVSCPKSNFIVVCMFFLCIYWWYARCPQLSPPFKFFSWIQIFFLLLKTYN